MIVQEDNQLNILFNNNPYLYSKYGDILSAFSGIENTDVDFRDHFTEEEVKLIIDKGKELKKFNERLNNVEENTSIITFALLNNYIDIDNLATIDIRNLADKVYYNDFENEIGGDFDYEL